MSLTQRHHVPGAEQHLSLVGHFNARLGDMEVGRSGIWNPGGDESKSVSRKHAQISWRSHDNVYEVTDLGSTNGTFVNGEKIAAHTHTPLLHGSVVSFGPPQKADGEANPLVFEFHRSPPGALKKCHHQVDARYDRWQAAESEWPMVRGKRSADAASIGDGGSGMAAGGGARKCPVFDVGWEYRPWPDENQEQGSPARLEAPPPSESCKGASSSSITRATEGQSKMMTYLMALLPDEISKEQVQTYLYGGVEGAGDFALGKKTRMFRNREIEDEEERKKVKKALALAGEARLEAQTAGSAAEAGAEAVKAAAERAASPHEQLMKRKEAKSLLKVAAVRSGIASVMEAKAKPSSAKQ